MSTAFVLLKFSLLLSAAYSCTVCGTAPQPTPEKCEQSKFDGFESKYLRAVIKWLPPLFLTPSLWLTFACETIFILRSQTSSPPHLEVRLTSAFLTGWILLTSGALIRLLCYRYLGRYFTFELAVRADHKLITTGPYSVVRHPAYTGSIMGLAGVALIELSPGSSWAETFHLWTTTGGAAVAFIWLTTLFVMSMGIIARTSAEDEVLRAEFREQWKHWAKGTPYKLLPGFF